MGSLVNDILDWLHPPTCLACQAMGGVSGSFCLSCKEAITPKGYRFCPGCGVPLAWGSCNPQSCPGCLAGKPLFDRIFILGPYEGLLRDLILRGKTSAGELLMESLGVLMAEATLSGWGMTQTKMAWVTTIPSPFVRNLKRGHNPAASLACGISGKMGLPFVPGLLTRAKASPKQAYLSKSERMTNMRGAFRARIPVKKRGGTVLLVDDVTTTGATLVEAARQLKIGGIGRVIPVVLARTP